MGGGLGIWVKLHPRVLFNFFLVPSMRPQLTLRNVDFRSVHPKTCFGGGCVPLGSICPGGQIFPFLAPNNHFSMGRIRLSFWMGVNRKHPLWLMIAP